MPVSPIDYRYGRDEAKEIWSRDGRHARLLEVERALVWAHCQMGRVSAEDYDAIADVSDPANPIIVASADSPVVPEDVVDVEVVGTRIYFLVATLIFYMFFQCG